MENVKLTFRNIPDGTKAPIGYLFVRYHIVFNVKMGDLRNKAWLVMKVT